MSVRAPETEEAELLVAVAEASAWIALLHGPRRTPAAERGLQHWLEESALHRRAFEHATETWNQTRGTVRRSAKFEVSVGGDQRHASQQRISRRTVFAAAATVLVAIAAVMYWPRSTVSTAVGERRIVMLDDGTQVSLNTSTQLLVRYNKHQRQVILESGEALFEVAKDAERPFTVIAGEREVIALGTAFLVRRDKDAYGTDERIAVTLVEGKVAVSDLTLVPGQRIVFVQHEAPILDRPVVEKLTAWQQGLVNIDNMTLSEAVVEMNRYSGWQLVVEGPAADIRVSGVFRLTDAENLATAVAMTHGLSLRKEGRRIVLSGIPQPPSEARFGPEIRSQ